MHLYVIQILYVLVLFFHGNDATHFRGGTISWKPTGNGTEVEFLFKLGWAYNRGPGCTSDRIGKFIEELIPYYWICLDGCFPPRRIANTSYICTGASESENWEQGENTFTYTFPGIGPYTVEFTGGDWMNLSYGSPGRWSIGTVVNLATRNDTNQPNLSPITTGKPIYVAQYGCLNEIRIPVVDPDGDDIRCRWANGSECVSICGALPYATIDHDNCTIRFIANHTSNGTFAVAVTVEDYPHSNISIADNIHPATSPLSTITLQFIVETPILDGVNCTDGPQFVSPTLAEGTILQTDIFKPLNISFSASGSTGIANIDLTVPAGMVYTPLQTNVNGSSSVHSSWIPQQNQVGTHLVCAVAKDGLGKTSSSRCITVVVNDVSPCKSFPCKHGGTCVRQRITQNFVCNCLPGYSGNLCDIDIDECASSPCQNNGTCSDHVNQYNCTCMVGYTGDKCQTDIDECASLPCQHNSTCKDDINRYSCLCPLGFTGLNCESDIGQCGNFPCEHGGTCDSQDATQNYTCNCVPGYTGHLCETDINECDDQPCSLLFDCVDLVNGFSCKLVLWKMLIIVLSVLMMLGILTFLFCFLKRKGHNTGVHPEQHQIKE